MNATTLVVAVAALAIGFSIHEGAHAIVAHLLGDRSPADSGRVTWRFWRHLSPVGSFMVPIALLATVGFLGGWARPVRVDPNVLRGGCAGLASVALAGPMANVVLAAVGVALLRTGVVADPAGYLWLVVVVQVGLFAVNILPIPPLDGGVALAQVLPSAARTRVLERGWAGLALVLPVLVLSPWVPTVVTFARHLAFGVPKG